MLSRFSLCEKLNRRRHRYQLLYFRTQQTEVARIPCVDVVCTCLDGARRNQPVINCSAHNSHPCDAADGDTILIAVEPYQGKPLLNFLYEQICRLSAEALLSRIPGERAVHLREAVSGASGIFGTSSRKGGEAAGMVRMIGQQRRN